MVKATKTEAPAPPQSTHLDRVLGEVVLGGDLHSLSEQDRIRYYLAVCEATGLTPATRPFAYLELGDDRGGRKLVLYATKDATDQLRRLHKISVQVVGREKVGDVYVVTARATTPDGRMDESVGAVPLVREEGEWKTSSNGKRYFAGNGKMIPLKPDALANALMKAESKAKRRATLSLCGLGMIDESEIETIPHATQLPDTAPGILASPPVALPAPETHEPARANGHAAEEKPAKVSGPALKRLKELVAKATACGMPTAAADLEVIFGCAVDDLPSEMYTHAITLVAEACGKSLTKETRDRLTRSLEETGSDLGAFCQHFGCKADLSDFAPRHLLVAAALLARKEQAKLKDDTGRRGGLNRGQA